MVEQINQAEFEALGHPRSRLAKTPEGAGVLALAPLEGIKFPCRYKHGALGSCHGLMGFGAFAKRSGMVVRGRCSDGTIYLFRYE